VSFVYGLMLGGELVELQAPLLDGLSMEALEPSIPVGWME
jgi:hypothetical protein